MNKQTIIETFQAASLIEQRKITRKAIEYLTMEGHPVSRQALQYWRQNEMSRSKLSGAYLNAYQAAITDQLSRKNLTAHV